MERALGGGRASWSRKQDLRTQIRICTSILNPKMSVDQISDATKLLKNMNLPELQKFASELYKQTFPNGRKAKN